jgi:hypothetical protein
MELQFWGMGDYHTVLIDDKDWPVVRKYQWLVFKARERDMLYVVSKNSSHKILLHNLIMRPPDDLLVDHIDHNGLNNQGSNLRLATHQENMINRRPHRTYKGKPRRTQYKGISLAHPDYPNSKWRAEITANGKRIHLGTFDTEREAALAYNEAALKYHGEFAHLNKIK